MSAKVRQVAVISGKGGTGKTSLVASLAGLAQPLVLADCDVDASNLALLLGGLDGAHEPLHDGQAIAVDLRYCRASGRCAEVCRFEAVAPGADGRALINPFFCVGCGACVLVCPEGALELHANQVGVWTVRPTPQGPLIHAALGIAQENSLGLVRQVRQRARAVAAAQGLDLILLDGPPGIDAPVQATVEGVDLLLVVAEATPSGVHDLTRVLELSGQRKLSAAVVINKADLDAAAADTIEELARRQGAAVLARLPFDADVPRALARGEPPLQIPAMAPRLQQLWTEIKALLHARKQP